MNLSECYQDCTKAEVRAIRGRECSNGQSAVLAFHRQRYSAKRRGIEWKMTLKEWWSIWQASGLWEKRGRGDGYAMARFNDCGPYEVGNVYICHCSKNTLDYQERKNATAYHQTREEMINRGQRVYIPSRHDLDRVEIKTEEVVVKNKPGMTCAEAKTLLGIKSDYKLAQELGVTRQAVSIWSNRGVMPPGRADQVYRLKKERGNG